MSKGLDGNSPPMPSPTRIFAALALASVFPSALALDVCTQIQQAVSSASGVYSLGARSANFAADLAHWVESSTQSSACSVEPGTPADVSIVIQLLGKTKTPFAVKGGGHSGNPGFSSTTGVQISMTRFSTVNYDKTTGTVAIGSGLIWDEVYAALEPHGVIVAGGRVSGVGMAGFTLGGGYNWLANQVGLTVDTVTAYDLVRPNGSIVSVTAASDPDLFFALKGGGNNFGIVTQFTLKAFPQGQVWGGVIFYAAAQLPAVTAAVARFASNVTDKKAAIIPGYTTQLGKPVVANIMFYDGPSPPAGIFDEFLAIEHTTEDISTRSFLSLVQSAPANVTAGTRGSFHAVSLLNYTPKILAAIQNETIFWNARLASAGVTATYNVEPFFPNIYTHNTSPTAFPFTRTPPTIPLNLQFTWTSPSSDSIAHAAMRESADYLTQVAVQTGQAVAQAPLYPNYALFGTPLERLYGSNLPRLRAIKARVDPHNIMGLAGGWRF
ncbi:FAD-binding domain-containing protein [Mycena alexandri]|uniref:FAD-binding domain-containing protein n=1 Tax=Mycena alexandri TaxID=1745969 RepID=A0AAD6SMH5_9AGAR|nr:FAD-binding domain-containing protein [Mycena alexandri]